MILRKKTNRTKLAMKEFKVNDFLTLKLEHGKNNIYVGDEVFNQCKYLILKTQFHKPDMLNGMESVDEVADALGWSEEGQMDVKYEHHTEIEFDSWEEFWGYCSSLQAWYEHEYDARLLHSSLAFPLLKKLVEVGDPLAKRVFKEEIAKRFKSGYPNAAVYIIQEHLLDHFNKEERKQLIKESLPIILKSFGKLQIRASLTNSDAFRDLFKVAKENNLTKELFYDFIGVINETSDALDVYMFSELLEVAKENNLIKDYFLVFLNFTNNKKIRYQKEVFSYLLKVLQETGLKNEFFPSFLEQLFRLNSVLEMFNSIKKGGWIKEYFSLFLDKMYLLHDREKNKVFSLLVEVLKEGGLKKEFFIALLDTIDKFSIKYKYSAFYQLIDSFKNTELFNQYNSVIETKFLVLLKDIDNLPGKDKYHASYNLIKVAIEKEWMGEYFPILIKPFEKFTGLNQYEAFFKLVSFFNSNELLDRFKPQLEIIFTILLKNMENLAGEHRSSLKYSLLEIAINLGLLEEHFLEFLKLPEFFYHLIYSNKETKVLAKFLPQIEKELLSRLDKLDVNKTDLYGSNSQNFFTFEFLVSLSIQAGLLDRLYSPIEAKFLPLWYKLEDGCGDKPLMAFLHASKESGLIKKHFPAIVKTIGDMNGWDNLMVYTVLLKVAKEEDWLEEYFFVFLESIDKIDDIDKIQAFEEFVKQIKSWKKYATQVENKFLTIVEVIGDSYGVFAHVLRVAKDYNFITTKDRFLVFLKQLKKNLTNKLEILFKLYDIAAEKKWIEELFPDFLETVGELSGEERYSLFSGLIYTIKNTELIDRYEELIATHFLALLNVVTSLEDPKNDYDDDYAYYDGAQIVDIHGDVIEPFFHLQYSAFNILINAIKETKLLELLLPHIKTQFHILLKRIDKLCDSQDIYSKFGNEDGVNRFDCKNLVKAVKGTDLENEIEFKEWMRKNSLELSKINIDSRRRNSKRRPW